MFMTSHPVGSDPGWGSDVPSLWPCYSCCRDFWTPAEGTFGPECLGVVGQVPLWITTLVVVLRYVFGPLRGLLLPQWLRTFAAESPAQGNDEETGDPSAANLKTWTPWTMCLVLLSVTAVNVGAMGALVWPGRGQQYLMPVIPSIVSALIIAIERPRTTSGAVLVIQSSLLFFQSAILIIVPNAAGNDWQRGIAWTSGILMPVASLVILLNMPMRDPLLDSTEIGKPFDKPTSAVRSPEDIITLWQWMTVSWMGPLIALGYKRQLHDEDVYQLSLEFQHDRLHRLFRELQGSVIRRLINANGFDLFIMSSLSVLEMLMQLAVPLLLRELLQALTATPRSARTALIIAGAQLFCRLVSTQSSTFNIWFCRRAYERSRGEMITMIYEKTLRRKAFTFAHSPSGTSTQVETAADTSEPAQLRSPSVADDSTATTLTDDESEINHEADDPAADKPRYQRIASWLRQGYQTIRHQVTSPPTKADSPASTGKILSLMRSDVYNVAQRFWEFPSLITMPLKLILSTVLVCRMLGPAALIGTVLLFLGMIGNSFLMNMQILIEQERRGVTDSKLQRTSQFVESIRHLRWYNWQDSWLDQIMDSRRTELWLGVRSNLLSLVIKTLNSLTSSMFPVVAFGAFICVSGQAMSVDVVFPALDLFATLQSSLRELPQLLTVLISARVSMQRIESFMKEPDKESSEGKEDEEEPVAAEPPGKLEIELQDASFSWPNCQNIVLNDVNMVCGPGLTVVCGRVGIGKTALLQAILGELDQHGGKKTVPRETIGYCSQSPWLESMSIRQNILFASGYDKARFERVIDACCLRDDLNTFRFKDLTLIGENGVGLSGGQRARVALARALYSQARTLLLDDPIAALDHQTASSIVRNLFADKNSALTAGRLVIFVTHRVGIVARYADQVLEVSNGGYVTTMDAAKLENHKEDEPEHTAADVDTAVTTEVGNDYTEVVADKFIQDEHRVKGNVLASVYWQYVKAGRLSWWTVLILTFVLFRGASVAYFWFLKEWGDRYKNKQADPNMVSVYAMGFGGDVRDLQDATASQLVFEKPLGLPDTSTNGGWIDLGRYLPSPDDNVGPWLLWFAVLSLVQVVTMALSDATLVVIVYKAGKTMFEEGIRRVSNATFRFYDVTPVGRLMNRLTSDMGAVDGQIASQLMDVAFYVVAWLSSVAVIASATPLFLLLSVGIASMFYFVFDYFIPTSQSLRRLEMVSLSPLMSNFGTLIEGLTTVRAFRGEPHFQNRNILTTDAFQRMDHIYWSLQAWLQYRFDILSALTSFALTLTAVTSGLSSGTVAFVLAAASNFVLSTHTLCRKYGELQMQFVSVERVVELMEVEQEPLGSIKPPAAWPSYGEDITFDHVTLCYAPDLDPVLTDICLKIPGGSNVAVTGRTGSGKSTLALSLLGTLHPDPNSGGAIRIGAVDLATVDKHALRRNITFVAQDPVLFPGTLSDNLDPLGERDEAERAEVLARVFQDGEFTLDSSVDAGGRNMSQGQRQLVGLARAILRRSPVVIMDEATASIDAQTAQYIQQLLREELRYSTVLTIAHRAEAVRGASYEIVLDAGKILRAGPLNSRQ
ncbi:hypothetical protein B0H63DRAFT_466399 [Podospora didyma]|uniref:ABC transporter n=1 Tax=Podospora didyma TaxID=330526 RepID=A0AAE0P007_9PEZI|nr:hypothetical protein B0H63DRAFT_466399 [Podospora didyma]